MELLSLYWKRLIFWSHFIGTKDYFNDRIGPVTAWRVACSIHPLEDLKKWWLGTGWMGPGAPDLYCCSAGRLLDGQTWDEVIAL